jgi:uncharacterized protein YjiS (DUF1127 family)
MAEANGWTRKTESGLRRLPEWLRLTFEGWREHARLRREMAELEQRGELDRTLSDAGLSQSDVPRLMQAHPQTPQQLAQMMRRLGLERARLPQDAGTAAELRAMEWRCAGCGEWRHCRAWLAEGSEAENYHRFCPNAAALDELRRAVAAARSAPQGVLAELALTHGEAFGR